MVFKAEMPVVGKPLPLLASSLSLLTKLGASGYSLTSLLCMCSLLYPTPTKEDYRTDHKLKNRLDHMLNLTFSTYYFVKFGNGDSLCLLASGT